MRKIYRFVIVLAILSCFGLQLSAFAQNCPCSIWNATTVPGTVDGGDGTPGEFGVRFTSDVNGFITGVRFYKSATNTGAHIGNLWSNTGTLLASATFIGESASGWQQVNFSPAVPVTAGTTYVASYYAPNGHYSFNGGFFGTSVDNPPLHALANGTSGANGVYAYSGNTTFPASTYNASNYWVDVVFSQTDFPNVTANSPSLGATGVSVSTSVSATFSEALDPTTVNGSTFELLDAVNNVVSASVTYNSGSQTAFLQPTSPLAYSTTYTVIVRGGAVSPVVKDVSGNALPSNFTWSFATATAPTPTPTNCPCSIWNSATLPAVADGGDPSAVELGVRFTADVNGYISGIRFYKSAANTGTHIGNLWSNTGALLATATFIGESGSGWQQVNFSTAVPVTAGTTYVASYYAPKGHYSYNGGFFGSNVNNPPLHALANGTTGADGIYAYSGSSVFPSFSYNSANYWVDVVFDPVNVPNVTNYSPVNGATAVSLTAPLTATFSVPVDPATVTDTTFQLMDSSNNVIAASVSYNSATQTASLQPSSALLATATYTAVIKGGSSGQAIKNLSGNALPANFAWSFQTLTPPPPPPVCPCSVWNLSSVPSAPDSGDGNSGEFGFKFTSDFDGSITGIRFYKSAANTGVHVGHLWTSTGTLLASATFAGESSSGWQLVTFNSPVTITAGTTYVASYYAPNGHYAFNSNYFNNAVDNPPLHAVANSSSSNGVYSYGASGFPTSSWNATNYWVDVVFIAAGTQPGVGVSSTSPTAGASGIGLGAAVSATFNEPMNAGTLSSSTFLVADSSNNPVAGTVTYNSATATVTFRPNIELAPFTTHTATLKGTIADAFGDVLGTDYGWSFTTGAPPSVSGPGGPILVISSSANPFSRYYDEILRAEGLNAFTVQDMSTVTASTMALYRVAVLGDMALTSAQVSIISNWVQAGGRLIAMHPDKKLATLLGLTPTSQILSDKYLLVNTSTGPGVGIVNQTIQYHGPADLYSLSGATKIATLYSSSAASTSYPAVTIANVGSGQAAAFTYDLARSVVYTRQGNSAWSGEQRDPYIDPAIGFSQIRSTDLYYGNATFDPEPDWVDLNKVAIPQADEQQRLLANMIEQMSSAYMPLPRFWYLPSGFKAVIVMTGDDHNQGGTVGRFNTYIQDSPTNCSVQDWQCVRSTSYIWPGTPISDAQAASYTSQGFELSIHPDSNPTCSNWTPSELAGNYSVLVSSFKSNWPSAGAPATVRTHCITWSDYDTQPQVEFSNGIRMDTNYYYWPDPWVQGRPGFFTGSGMPMRFADRNGNTIDVYQAATQMPDEVTWNLPTDINTLLNNALGASGFYGVFTMNFHTDTVDSPDSDAVVPAAQALHVPIVSAKQMLTWLDGRNNSSFSSLSWSGTTLSFSIVPGTGARNLQAMLPTSSVAGALQSIKLNGTAISYTTQTIKGIKYAFFPASAGSYQAIY